MLIEFTLPQRLDSGASPAFAGITLTGPGLGANGNASAPSWSFASDTGTGWYRVSAGVIGITNSGVRTLSFSASGLITGSGTETIQLNGSNITLTPSGSGSTNLTTNLKFTGANGDYAIQALGQGGNCGLQFITGGTGPITFDLGGVNKARFAATTGNLLLGGLTTDGTGVLQFPAATTSAGGITFGDVDLYRTGSESLTVNGATSSTFGVSIAGSRKGYLGASGSNITLSATSAFGLILETNGAAALTLDSSQSEALSGAYRTTGGSSAGAVKTTTDFVKAVTAIADATPTGVLTITVPNAAHSASVRVTLVGSLGAGGAVGANEASGTVAYDIAIARTAGVNAVATISTAYGSGMASVAGAATITVTAAMSAVSGAVGATNTFTVNVTITKGSGASANHTCLVDARVRNANAAGITLS